MDTRKGQFGRFQQGQRKGAGPTHEELAAKYGPLVFDTAVPMLPELHAKGVQLESDHPAYICEVMGAAFADAVVILKNKIRATVPEEHRGAFDGWVKLVAKREFGPGSDFAQEYGDQELNLLCLVLSHQAGRVADMRCGEKILGREVPDTKTAWRAVGPELEAKIASERAKFEEAKSGGVKPWDKVEPFSAFIARKAAHDTLMRGGVGRFKYLGGVVTRLKKWANSGLKDEQPTKTRKEDHVLAQIAGMMEQITGLKAEELAAVEKSEYGIAGEKKTERVKFEADVRKLEGELQQLTEAEQKPAANGKGDKQPEPIAKIADAASVITDAVRRNKASAPKPVLTLKDVNTILDRKVEERQQKQKALAGRTARIEELTKLMEAAQASGNKKQYGLLMVEQAGHEETVPRLAELIGETDARIAELEAAKAELDNPLPVVDPVAPVTVPAITTTLKEFLLALKASELGEPDQKALRVRAIGDLTGAIAEFAEMTTPEEVVEETEPELFSELDMFKAELAAADGDDDIKAALLELAESGKLEEAKSAFADVM